MAKVRVIGKPFGSRPVGEVFRVSDVEARALVALKRVERAEVAVQVADPAPAPAPADVPAKAAKKAAKKRTYKRRDMQAED